MFTHQFADAPEGTLAHAGYMLYLADLRFKVGVRKALRALERWIANN